MTAKLKLILRRIPWYLLLKGGVAGAAWLWLSWWLFATVAILVYAIPLFDPRRFLFLFAIILTIALLIPRESGVIGALYVGVLVVLLIGIKDLVFIRRVSMYRALVYLILFASTLLFFQSYATLADARLLLLTVGMSATFAMLLLVFLEYELAGNALVHADRRRALILGYVGGLLIWQFMGVLMFLPLHMLHQTILLFLGATLLFELFREHAKGALSPRGILTAFTFFFIFIVAVLALTEWRI